MITIEKQMWSKDKMQQAVNQNNKMKTQLHLTLSQFITISDWRMLGKIALVSLLLSALLVCSMFYQCLHHRHHHHHQHIIVIAITITIISWLMNDDASRADGFSTLMPTSPHLLVTKHNSTTKTANQLVKIRQEKKWEKMCLEITQKTRKITRTNNFKLKKLQNKTRYNTRLHTFLSKSVQERQQISQLIFGRLWLSGNDRLWGLGTCKTWNFDHHKWRLGEAFLKFLNVLKICLIFLLQM